MDADTLQKRVVIRPPQASAQGGEAGGSESSLPFLTWSAGQREFIPLLLGLYRLMPAGAVGRRGALEWVIIEVPEMGLHPRAIAATTSVRNAAQRALAADYRTYSFERGAPVRDISALDPMSDDPTTAGWGGLTTFSERVANVVARVVARSHSVERTA